MMELIIWTIHNRGTLDFPNHIVMRPYKIVPGRAIPQQVAGLYDSVDEAREDALDMGLGCLPRDPDDEPLIVESWL